MANDQFFPFSISLSCHLVPKTNYDRKPNHGGSVNNADTLCGTVGMHGGDGMVG
jgi:hypothetical protein